MSLRGKTNELASTQSMFENGGQISKMTYSVRNGGEGTIDIHYVAHRVDILSGLIKSLISSFNHGGEGASKCTCGHQFEPLNLSLSLRNTTGPWSQRVHGHNSKNILALISSSLILGLPKVPLKTPWESTAASGGPRATLTQCPLPSAWRANRHLSRGWDRNDSS